MIARLREKETYEISETWSILVYCSLKCTLGFFVQLIFPGRFDRFLLHNVYQSLDDIFSTYVDPRPEMIQL